MHNKTSQYDLHTIFKIYLSNMKALYRLTEIYVIITKYLALKIRAHHLHSYGKQQLRHSTKYLVLCSTEEIMCFSTANDDRMFIWVIYSFRFTACLYQDIETPLHLHKMFVMINAILLSECLQHK